VCWAFACVVLGVIEWVPGMLCCVVLFYVLCTCVHFCIFFPYILFVHFFCVL